MNIMHYENCYIDIIYQRGGWQVVAVDEITENTLSIGPNWPSLSDAKDWVITGDVNKILKNMLLR